MADKRKLISVITPCFNEEKGIRECYEVIRNLFESKLPDYDYEHIFSDNASSDQTVQILKDIAADDKRVKIIVNSRNYGPGRSNFNALIQSKGDAVLAQMVADLQDPPEVLCEFIKKWEEGYHVSYGIRTNRQESFFMRSMRHVYYRVLNRLADVHIPPDVGEFQLIDKQVVDALRQCDDYYPYIRGMIANCGFKTIGIEYKWALRKHGTSKTRFFELIDQGLNGIISFTQVPLRLCTIFGFSLASLSLLYAFVVFILNVVYYQELNEPGIPTLVVTLFFFSGMQLFFLGLLGEYIAAIHSQVRKRPMVVELEKVNFDE